jgi:hypothetical protein
MLPIFRHWVYKSAERRNTLGGFASGRYAMPANTAEDQNDDLEDTQETEALQESDTDNVGDASVELNIEELINELEADGLMEACTSEHAAKKKRLEELMELRRARQDLEDFDDYDV